jgi:uncharacterized Zn finger protein (UPF0148 family)
MPVNETQLAVGAINASTAERKMLAAKSGDYVCPVCKIANKDIAEKSMKKVEDSDGSELKKASQEMNLQFNKPAAKENMDKVNGEADSK